MPQAIGSGFQGSDTDGLDKIVKTMNDAAALADKITMVLRAICVALDAMSWTGYAAALSAYLKGTVIPLLQTVSRNLKLFAKVVGLASSVQKDTSSNKLIINAGDAGYTPIPIAAGKADPDAATAPAGPDQQAVASGEPGAVNANALDSSTLKTVASDISDILAKVRAFAESADHDGVQDGTLSQQIGKLGELVGSIEKFVHDLRGDASGESSDSGSAGENGTGKDAAGTDGGDGADQSGQSATSGMDAAPGTGTSTPGTGAGQGTGTDAGDGTAGGAMAPGAESGRSYSAGEIWQAVTSALRELGIIGPDGSVQPGDATGAGGPSAVDGAIDRSTVAGDINGIQAGLDRLREHLGIVDPSGSDSAGAPDFTASSVDGASAPTGQTFGPAETGTSPTSLTSDGSPVPSYSAEPSPSESPAAAPSGGGTPPSFSPESGSGSGGGSGGGEPSGGGSTGGGSGGGDSGSGSPTGGSDQNGGQPTQTYRAETVGQPVATAVPAGTESGVQTRLVATSGPATGLSTSGSAAIPLSGAAVAASLLGGLYARRSRDQEDPEADGNAEQEVFAAAPTPAR